MSEYTTTSSKIAAKPMVFDLNINQPPPQLTLMINPETLDIKFTPKISESRIRWTDQRNSSYILQAHHDELDVLSASGQSALFYGKNGLTSLQRTQTKGYENIQQLLAIYRNNGMNFNKKPGQRGSNVIESVGRVIITYDQIMYIGSFESFQLNEGSEKPFNLNFSFDFKVTKHFDATKFNR